MGLHDRLERLEKELLASGPATHDEDPEPIFEERLAKHKIRNAVGTLNHLQMLRGYGLYWGGSPQSHQRFVQENQQKLFAATEQLALIEVLKHCTDAELDRIAAEEPPEVVVEGFEEKMARECRRLRCNSEAGSP